MPEQPPVVIITRDIPGDPPQIPGATVLAGPAEPPSREAVLARVRGAAVVITMFSDRVDRAFLESAGTGLRGVCNFAVGVDNIDLVACRERGVIVTNTPDAVTEGTANMAIGLLLAVARRIVEGDRFVRSGAWSRRAPLSMAEMLGPELAGATMHIVGAGRIGRATALRARALGMRVLYTARSGKPEMESSPIDARRVGLDDGLRLADVVSMHTPLTDETRHLLDRRRIGLLKQRCIVINTARGPVIDEAALAAALSEGRIYGAGLDVFEREPEVHAPLLSHDRVVLTPHIGSGEWHWRRLMSRMVLDAAEAILHGREPEHRVV
ncbi:MAG: 2-hydroxyacid dehydrogenase [Phycisphaerales bacterium]